MKRKSYLLKEYEVMFKKTPDYEEAAADEPKEAPRELSPEKVAEVEK